MCAVDTKDNKRNSVFLKEAGELSVDGVPLGASPDSCSYARNKIPMNRDIETRKCNETPRRSLKGKTEM